MTQYYIKNDDGEFVDADDLVEKGFQEKSSKIVAAKLNAGREKMENSIREEIATAVREETTETIRKEITTELEAKHKEELDVINKEADSLKTQLRRKVIAAEYGFKADAEQFLGDGSEEEMRSKADVLKSSFSQEGNLPAPEKKTKDPSAGDGFVTLC